jgi:hypothetical protein
MFKKLYTKDFRLFYEVNLLHKKTNNYLDVDFKYYFEIFFIL